MLPEFRMRREGAVLWRCTIVAQPRDEQAAPLQPIRIGWKYQWQNLILCNLHQWILVIFMDQLSAPN